MATEFRVGDRVKVRDDLNKYPSDDWIRGLVGLVTATGTLLWNEVEVEFPGMVSDFYFRPEELVKL